MKSNPAYSLRIMGDVYLLVPLQAQIFQKDNILPTNEIGAFLWNTLKNDCTEETLLNTILNEYDIDKETALKDIRSFLSSLQQIGALEQ